LCFIWLGDAAFTAIASLAFYRCYCFKPGLLAATSSLILAVKCCYCCNSFIFYVMMVVTRVCKDFAAACDSAAGTSAAFAAAHLQQYQ
jgi:hypothetical protein